MANLMRIMPSIFEDSFLDMNQEIPLNKMDDMNNIRQKTIERLKNIAI